MGKSNPLEGLDPKRAKIAYEKSLVNSDNHVYVAELIAKGNLYGFSVTHLVLSTEETVKCFIFYLQSIGLEVDKTPLISMYFTDHILRHKFAVFFSIMYKTFLPLMSMILLSTKKGQNPKSKFTDEEKLELKQSPEKLINAFGSLTMLLEWWDNANNKKNEGLYVDVRELQICSPSDISKIQYINAIKLVKSFNKSVKELIEKIELANSENSVEFKRIFIENKLASNFSYLAQARKKERKGKINLDII